MTTTATKHGDHLGPCLACHAEMAAARVGPVYPLLHLQAMATPNRQERPLVALVEVAAALQTRYGRDYLYRGEVAAIIVATRSMLSGDWGERLDRGTIDGQLVAIADRMGFNTDTEEFTA